MFNLHCNFSGDGVIL